MRKRAHLKFERHTHTAGTLVTLTAVGITEVIVSSHMAVAEDSFRNEKYYRRFRSIRCIYRLVVGVGAMAIFRVTNCCLIRTAVSVKPQLVTWNLAIAPTPSTNLYMQRMLRNRQ